MHTTEPLVPEPSCFEVEVPIVTVKRYKSPGFDQFPAELIQAGSNTLQSEVHELINPMLKKGRNATTVEGIHDCACL
jgi:hypothetical protein